MMGWALRDPTRFLRERTEVDRLMKEVDWLAAVAWRLDAGFAVKIDLDLEIHGNIYALMLVLGFGRVGIRKANSYVPTGG